MRKIISISGICILIDQLIKLIVSTNMEFTSSINVINNFFRITYLQNNGAAFSILTGNRVFLIFITTISLFFIYFVLIKNKKLKKIEIICYGTLLGGIIGNLIDRIRIGYVIDYLDFNFGAFNYPVFNFADICIVVSAVILLIISFKEVKYDRD